MTIILIITGILTALCLVMAAVSGEFSLSKEEKERIERELERKREIKRERKKKSFIVKILESNPYPRYS